MSLEIRVEVMLLHSGWAKVLVSFAEATPEA